MLIILHISAMLVATVCLITGIGIAVFGRKKKNWLKLHRTINTVGAVSALTGAAMAFANVIVTGGSHLAGLHQRGGLIATLLIGLALFWGFYTFKAKNKAAARAVHRWSGRVAFIAMLAALILGLALIGIF